MADKRDSVMAIVGLAEYLKVPKSTLYDFAQNSIQPAKQPFDSLRSLRTPFASQSSIHKRRLPAETNGAGGGRTRDLLHAMQARSLLRYGPVS